MAAKARKVAKKAAKTPKGAKYTAFDQGPPSKALPWATAPATLDGTLLGDNGFDPLGFSLNKNDWFAFEGLSGIRWMREAELVHGRIAQLAALGFVWPGLIGTFPSTPGLGLDAFAETNPLQVWGHVPALSGLQILSFMIWIEVKRLNIIKEEGNKYMLGDLKLGQGEGRWNPFSFAFSPEAYEIKQRQELEHCRVAMVGVLGLYLQAKISGMGIVEQLSSSFASPEYAAKAGYFLPEGI
eukprot:CAMPEP_0118718992 /NCGR_PEP_ID=MMETSP0800-20121206/29154_1 /TAXON_ID=210618 ORGANISM="Striatella unipunctata, Strain CCMP2910" /NCGR_SAMPLE_ID=MMETSP0800 /ASSEMBLY_ACC=CAM_ASM_000638 /LENGTH=239 /DNA_ID=CAMNT_0006626165 /DNA_START=51 /DNA_END=770 /DNA_ORIENTATION=+